MSSTFHHISSHEHVFNLTPLAEVAWKYGFAVLFAAAANASGNVFALRVGERAGLTANDVSSETRWGRGARGHALFRLLAATAVGNYAPKTPAIFTLDLKAPIVKL